jgi:hypothetical protein
MAHGLTVLMEGSVVMFLVNIKGDLGKGNQSWGALSFFEVFKNSWRVSMESFFQSVITGKGRFRKVCFHAPLFSVIFFLTLGLFWGIEPMAQAEAAGKITVLRTGEQPGHYLVKNGKPLLLIGDNVTQGWVELGANFDQRAYVDALASRGLNLLMLWSYMGTNAAGQQGDSRIGYNAPEIWPWAGSPDQRTFDLTSLNQAYFDRLKELVAYAESKGVMVLITVHDGWIKDRFDRHPFNPALGNGPLTYNYQYVELADYDREMPTAFSSSWTWQQKNQYFQERFCDKVIIELNAYSNVIYEMFNEGKWYDATLRNKHEQHFLKFFRARGDNLLLTNSDEIVLDNPHSDSKVDVVTYHGDWTGRFNDFQSGFNQSPAKPYLLSEPVPGWDGSNVSLDTIRRSVWEVAMAGAGWVNQNDLSFGWDPYAGSASKASLRDQAYDYAGHCARFFNGSGMSFWNMRPKGNLSSTGICLAQEGAEYAVYAPSGGSFTLDLSAGAGKTFAVHWYNPRTGQFEYQDSVQGGSGIGFTSPDRNDWVVYLIANSLSAPIPSTEPVPQDFLVEESLATRPASATVKGGTFTSEGWKTTSNSDYLEFHLSTIRKGSVEFDVKGWSKSAKVFNDPDHKYHFFGMWDGSWTGQTGTAQIKYNPYKAHLRVYGFDQKADGTLDYTYYSMLKLRLNVRAFTDGGETDPNAFECYANPDSYPQGSCVDQGIRTLFSWDATHTYHFKIEWGDGAMRWYMDGQEITYYDYSRIGKDAYDPADHVVRLGTVFYPVPLGTIYSNLKVSAGESSAPSACSQLGGTPCSTGKTCAGGQYVNSSDYGALCCVGGTCQDPAPQNNPPVAYGSSISTSQNTPVSGTLSASDPDGNALTYTIVNKGSLGTASITNAKTGAYTYTPNSQVTGTDMFTFKVNDGQADSNVATVKITVQSSSPSPSTGSLAVSNVQATSGRAYGVEQGLKNGVKCYNDRDFVYSEVPSSLVGAAYIKTANDDKMSKGSQFLSFDVNQNVTVYVAHDNRLTAKPDWLKSFSAAGMGIRTDKPFSLFKKDFSAGNVVLGGNQLGDVNSSSMYTAILVGKGTTSTPTNNPPVAYDGTILIAEGTAISGTLSASDSDGDALTYLIVSNGSLGTASITNASKGTYSYTPKAGASGTDQFTFKVNDGKADSNVATVKVTIQASTPSPSILEVRNVKATSGKAYVAETGLKNGVKCYIDRDIVYGNVPSSLVGAAYIKTANDDKTSKGNQFLSFEVNQNMTVYVAHDNRLAKPDWLNSFSATGLGLQTDKPFSLFKRDYPAGAVVLGGNQTGDLNKSSMYTVMIVGR